LARIHENLLLFFLITHETPPAGDFDGSWLQTLRPLSMCLRIHGRSSSRRKVVVVTRGAACLFGSSVSLALPGSTSAVRDDARESRCLRTIAAEPRPSPPLVVAAAAPGFPAVQVSSRDSQPSPSLDAPPQQWGNGWMLSVSELGFFASFTSQKQRELGRRGPIASPAGTLVWRLEIPGPRPRPLCHGKRTAVALLADPGDRQPSF